MAEANDENEVSQFTYYVVFGLAVAALFYTMFKFPLW